jgi:Family of unknown function (DUF5947)
METAINNRGRSALAALQQFVRKPPKSAQVCELCAKPIGTDHFHLLELETHRITCACDACSILFNGNARQRYRRIPRDVYRLDQFSMDDHEWESLLIPINLAFFVYSDAARKMVAQYPSPGGVMESSLDLEYWSVIAERNPILSRLEPDVEALLVNRIGKSPQYFRVPIDKCFQLVGIIRTHWRGLSGGEEVWKEIDKFFQALVAQSGGALA